MYAIEHGVCMMEEKERVRFGLALSCASPRLQKEARLCFLESPRPLS